MQVLLIYTAADNASLLRPLLEDMDISVETLPIESQEEVIMAQFTAFFNPFDSGKEDDSGKEEGVPALVPRLNAPAYQSNAPTHIAILSPLSKRWFDFLAGFACGSRLPVIVYGEEAITGISEEFAPSFTFITNSQSLYMFLKAENEAFKKQEAAREIIRAQETLLRMGIPVTGESLAQCAGEGHVQEVSLFLAAGFSPDTRNKTGVPIINAAARNGNLEVARFLIAAGAQVNLTADDRGTSALLDGVMGNYSELVEELTNAGTDVNIKSKDGQTALIIAVGSGNEKIVEILLKAGADPDISDSLGASARKYATLFHKEPIMRLFDTYAPQKDVS
jgi:hypothetical protein